MSKFEKSIKGFQKYGDKVLAIVRKNLNEGEIISCDTIGRCYSMNIPPSICAQAILRLHKIHNKS